MLPAFAVIPCRKGSKGLPGKNIRPLCGVPLYRHAVAHAREAGIPRILISTDIPEILEATAEPDVEILNRPEALAGDRTPMIEVVLDILDRDPGLVGPMLLLQPTSPLRRPRDVRATLDLTRTGAFDLVMSVTEAERAVLKWGLVEGDRFHPLSQPEHVFSNRQSLPAVYRPNGAVYGMEADWLRGARSFAAGRIGVYRMTPEDAFDIDTGEDFARCERALAARESA